MSLELSSPTSPVLSLQGGRTLISELYAILESVDSDDRRLSALAILSPARARDWLIAHAPDADPDVTPATLRSTLAAIVEGTARDAGTDGDVTLCRVLHRFARIAEPATVGAFVARARSDDAGANALLATALDLHGDHAALLRPAVERAIAAARLVDADRLLTRLGRADPSQSTVRWIARRRSTLPETNAPVVRAAFVGSYTIEPLVPYFDLECRDLGLATRPYVGPFNAWEREMVDDSSALYAFAPEIAFLAVSLDDLIPELAGGLSASALQAAGDAAVERLVAVARRFVARSDAMLVVHTFHSAHPDPHGVAAASIAMSRPAWIAALNLRLRELLGSIPRVHLLDLGDVLLRRDGGRVDVPKMRHLAALRIAPEALPDVARAQAAFVAPLKGLTRKCVVVDLDNTLWGGIVGEDGVHGIKLGHTAPGAEFVEFQRLLRTLADRGILLAIASKNNPEDALAALRTHESMVLREEDFSAIRINWRPKPENLASIAEELGIGVDSLVFLDDNPKERALMRQMLPQVLTPELPADPSLYRQTVERLPQLQTLRVTAEDRSRVEQYRAKGQRERVRVTTGSLEEYLRSLNIRVEITPASTETLPRLHQLLLRTNQFNVTTRRHDAATLEQMAGSPRWRVYALRARDRFGDHGLVAAAIVELQDSVWRIDSFLMSCRVIGYDIETALLAALCADAAAGGATHMVGEFIPTAKNAPARGLWSRHGFHPLAAANGIERFELTLADGLVSVPPWIQSSSDEA